MQTIISDVSFKKTITLLESEYSNISEDGTFFAMFQTEYDKKGNVIHDFFDLIKCGVDFGYEYVNTIVYPSSILQDNAIVDNVKYVVWLCKNHAKMKFNKDAIREKHIWKDVEWGKRAKNYNPKGKDPGNVWIPTEDDGHAHITKHILLDDDKVITRLLDMTDCGLNYKLYKDEFKENSNNLQYTIKSSKNNNTERSYVIFGSSERMDYIANNTIKLAVTSPPYWDLKDYYKEGQIGQENYNSYLHRMKNVWQECYNKLSNSGTLWVNINIRVKSNKVILIPKDIIKMCREIGFYYKGVLIWHKSSGIPTGEKNIVDRHEYVLIFTKEEDYSVNKTIFCSYKDYKNEAINGGAFWNINRKAGSVGKKYIHPAIYPNELVERIININTNNEDLVLDPFLGSGTSIIAAENVGRKCIGYEYYEGFYDLMKYRFDSEIPNSIIEFVYDETD